MAEFKRYSGVRNSGRFGRVIYESRAKQMNKKLISLGLALGLLTNVASAQVEGDRVLAVWQADGYWYPGEVDYVDGQGIHIAFDDDDESVVSRNQVRRVDWRVGKRIQCDWKRQGKYYAGRIIAMRGENIEFLYDDGYKEQITISVCRSN